MLLWLLLGMMLSPTTSSARNVTTRTVSPGEELRWTKTAKTTPIWSHVTDNLHWPAEQLSVIPTKEIHGAWKRDLFSAFMRVTFLDLPCMSQVLLTAVQCLALSTMDGLKEPLKSPLPSEDVRFTAKIMQIGSARSISAATTGWHLTETENGPMGWTHRPPPTPHGWLAPPIQEVGSSMLTEMLVISRDSGSTSMTNQETAGTERINYLLMRGF